MRKRLLSLFLAVIMILLAVPTLAIVSLAEEAGTGTENKVVYSTSFSNDPTSENFPSIDLPAATDESTYVWNGLDFSGVGNFNEDGSFKSGNYKAGAITYKGNWEIGTIGVDWDAKGTAAPTVNVTSFYPYTDFYRASKSEICITTGNAIWGTGNAVQSGGLWLNSARNSMVAGIVYEKLDATPVETPSNNDGNASKVTAYVGTAAVRYTTEYAGTIDISAVAGVAYRNGVSLVILHNGTVVHTVNNADMTTNDGGKDLGTVKSGLAVEKGDTVDFVCLGDVNYDADSFEAAKEAAAYQGDAFDYNKAKRGIREFDFTVNYSAIAGSEYSSTFGPGYEYPVVDLDTNTITSYPDAWKVGAFDATATKTTVTNEDETTTRTDWSAVTVGNKFTAYDKVDRSSGYAITSAIGGGTWGSAAGGYGGALWMGTGYTNSFSVGVNYSGSDPRTVNSIYAVSGAVYTAEYAGDITVDFSVGYTITNGTRLLIRHNGVDVQIYEHGTETGSVKITGVCTGDTIEFVCIPDLNFDADSYTYYGYEYFLYSGTSPDYKVSTHAKMGVKLKSFKVTYDVGYGIDSTSSWDGDDYTVTKVADKINTIQSNPDYFLFRWYTNGADGVQGNADDVPVTAVNSAAAGTITYAKINPYLMSEDTAGITSGMTYKEAFEKYVAFMKTLLRIDYAGDWTMAYDNNGEVSPIRYLLLVAQDNPFMLSSTDNQIASFAQAGYMVDEIEFERAMKTYYDNTFKNYDLAATSTLSFTAETLVSDIKVTYEKTGLTKVKGGGQHLYQGATNNSGTYATTLDLYLRPTDNVPSATVAMAYTASFSGKLTLSLDSFNWITEDLYPYVAIGVFKNGKAVTLNTEGLTLSSLATAMPTENNAANNTTAGNLQALETGLFYNATTGYYHLKLAASDTSVVKTNAAYTADSGDAFFVDLQKLFANTTINVAKGDEITIRIDRSNAYDNLLSKQERPTKLQLGLTAKTEASATIGATLEIYDDYAINLYVTPHNSTAEGAGIIVKDENGNPVTLLGVKQTNGSYKVTAKEDILIYELVYHNGSGYTGGTTVAYTPYEFGPDGVYTYYEKTVNTVDLLDDYINSGLYDSTTVELAKAVRSLAVSVAAEKGKVKGASVDTPSKGIIKGNPDGSGVVFSASELDAIKNALYELYPITYFPEDIVIRNKNPYEVLTNGSSYVNYGATVTNMMLQAYKDYINGTAKTLEEGYYLDITFPTGATVEENGVDVEAGATVRYSFPYSLLVEKTGWGVDNLTDEQKNSVTTKYMDATGNELNATQVKDVDNYGYKIVGANVSLGDSVQIAFLANGNGENSIYDLKQGYRLKVTTSDNEEFYGGFYLAEGNSGDSNLYMGVLVDLPVKYYNDALTIVIVDANGQEVSARLQYNVLTYCAKMYTFDSDYVLRGVYHLGVCAKAYADAHPATNA